MTAGFALLCGLLVASCGCAWPIAAAPRLSKYSVQPVDISQRRVILVRHGAVAPEQHSPPLRRGAFWGFGHNVPLSEDGIAEAQATAAFIQRHHSDEVRRLCASPLALHSSAILREPLRRAVVGGLPIQQYGLLSDVVRGAWVNMTRDEVAARWGADCFERWSTDDAYGQNVMGGEGCESVRHRALAVLDHALQRTLPGDATVICTHLWIIRQILAEALGEQRDHGLKIQVPTASVSVIDFPARDAHDPTFVPEELARGALFGRGVPSRPLVRAVGYKPQAEFGSPGPSTVGDAL